MNLDDYVIISGDRWMAPGTYLALSKKALESTEIFARPPVMTTSDPYTMDFDAVRTRYEMMVGLTKPSSHAILDPPASARAPSLGRLLPTVWERV